MPPKDAANDQDFSAGRVVHVWRSSPPQAIERERLDPLLDWLDDEERERFERFIPDRPRIEFLAGRILLRSMLGSCLGREPRSLRFRKSDLGKLFLAEPDDRTLSFNLSHTRGLVACAMARTGALGVDVEWTEPKRDTDALAERFFAAGEVEMIAPLGPAERRDAFYKVWTLKEAFLKATGKGLTSPLKHFCVRPVNDGTTEIDFDKSLALDPSHWRLSWLRPSPEHYLSVATQSNSSEPPATLRVIDAEAWDAPTRR